MFPSHFHEDNLTYHVYANSYDAFINQCMYIHSCFHKMINNIHAHVLSKNKDIGSIISRLGILIIYKNEKEKTNAILTMGLMPNCLKLRHIHCTIKVTSFFKSPILNHKYIHVHENIYKYINIFLCFKNFAVYIIEVREFSLYSYTCN